MSLLLDRLPTAVVISGKAVSIRTDFRYGIMFEMLCLDHKLSSREKVEKALRLMFTDLGELPLNEPQEIVDSLLRFYHGGNRPLNQHQINEQKKAKSQSQNISNRNQENEKLVYDYEYDDELIYDAFLQQYGIDLIDIDYMHWWKFKALMSGLTEDTKFMQVIGYRTAKISQNMSAQEKRRLRHMKDIYALPIPMDEVEKNNRMEAALKNGDVAALMRIIQEDECDEESN